MFLNEVTVMHLATLSITPYLAEIRGNLRVHSHHLSLPTKRGMDAALKLRTRVDLLCYFQPGECV